MRIALSIEHFEPSKGGGETYVRNFAHLLRQEGHEVHIYTLSWDPAETDFIFHRIPRPAQFRRYNFARSARKLLLQERFDIIQGLGKSIHMDILRPGGGVHRAWQDHDIRATDGTWSRLKRRIKQWGSLDQQLVLHLEKTQFGPGRQHRIIAVSRLVREEILRYYGCEPERIQVIHNGANLEVYTLEERERWRQAVRQELGLQDDDIMLLFLGHDFKRKGLHTLIRALPGLRARKDPFRLVVVGHGDRQPCDRLAQELGVADLVQYAGASSEPVRFYAAADIFCFPSFYDPCANVVLEALAMRLPVVTSTTNGSGELLTPGKEGYVVEPDDPEQLAVRIASLFDPTRREDAGLAARALAESRPIQRNYREITALYADILARKKAASEALEG